MTVSYITILFLGKPPEPYFPHLVPILSPVLLTTCSSWISGRRKTFPRKNVLDASVDLVGRSLIKRKRFRPSYRAQFVLYCILLYCKLYCIVLYCIVNRIVLYCIVLYCIVKCIVLYCIV